MGCLCLCLQCRGSFPALRAGPHGPPAADPLLDWPAARCAVATGGSDRGSLPSPASLALFLTMAVRYATPLGSRVCTQAARLLQQQQQQRRCLAFWKRIFGSKDEKAEFKKKARSPGLCLCSRCR